MCIPSKHTKKHCNKRSVSAHDRVSSGKEDHRHSGKKRIPQEQAKKRNLRVAAYCRVSTGDEEQLTSYENQKAFYTEKIMKNPEWTMVDVFADEGITGTSTCPA